MSSLRRIQRYKKSYKNYISVMIGVKNLKENMKVILKDGSTHTWTFHQVLQYILFMLNIKKSNVVDCFDGKSEYLQFNYGNKDISFYGAKNNGDIGGIFGSEDYKILKPENEIVVDIGANIGDSTIYFAINGARRVIALEPYPYSINFAIKNIEVNDLNNKITMLNAGYGKEEEIIKVDEKEANGSTYLVQSIEGKEVKLYSLKSLFNEFGIKYAVLKMDCEGCEYNLLNEDNDALRKFKRIVLEFHYGYKNIENKLKNAGFSTKVLIVQKSGGKDITLKKMALNNNDYTFGILYAELT